MFISVKDSDKAVILPAARKISDLGFAIIATGGTARYLIEQGLAVEEVKKVAEGRPHIVDRITDGGVDLIFNTTEGWQSLKDSQAIRISALRYKVPSFTTAAGESGGGGCNRGASCASLEVKSLQSYYNTSHD